MTIDTDDMVPDDLTELYDKAKARLEDEGKPGDKVEDKPAAEDTADDAESEAADDTADADADADKSAKEIEPAAAPAALPEFGPLSHNFLELQTDRMELEAERERFKEIMPVAEQIQQAQELFKRDPVAGMRAALAAVAGDDAAAAEKTYYDALTTSVLEGDSDIAKLSDQFRRFASEQRTREQQTAQAEKRRQKEAERTADAQQVAGAVQTIGEGLEKEAAKYPNLLSQRMYHPGQAVWSVLQEQSKKDPSILAPMSEDQLIEFGATRAEEFFKQAFPQANSQPRSTPKPDDEPKEQQKTESSKRSISQAEASEVSAEESKKPERGPLHDPADLEDFVDQALARETKKIRSRS